MRLTVLWLSLCAVACADNKAAPEPAAPESAANQTAEPAEPPAAEPPAAPKADAKSCAEAPGFRYERIELPPEFAPTMAKGVEILYFHPGMFDAKSPGYWSYVFRLAFEQDPGDLTKLLLDYYRGLIGAVGKSKGKTYDLSKITVKLVTQGGGDYRAHIELVDAFVTGKPLTVSLRLRANGHCIVAQAAPATASIEVRAALENATACIPCAN